MCVCELLGFSFFVVGVLSEYRLQFFPLDCGGGGGEVFIEKIGLKCFVNSVGVS